MIDIRRFEDLGTFENEWLDAHYHFSFSNYFDPARMGHGKLRVWNDDRIRAQTGFPPHGHRDMEIITYVRSGAITHRDSLGNEGRTEAGDVQVMSAGSGVQHSEWNAENQDTTLFQIWIEPSQAGGQPGWGARKFPKSDRSGQWAVLASGNKNDDALPIRQNARILGATLKAGDELEYVVPAGRYGYFVIADGAVKLNGEILNARDGAAVTGSETLVFKGEKEAEIVFVDTV
jgi:redox-sensitive bicupin YhaK (pirin superfamily)